MAGPERTPRDPATLEPALREHHVATESDHAEEAERSFARAELAPALEQIAAALSYAPSHPPYLERLEAIAERAAKPLALIPPSQSRFFGLEAVRGWLLAREGQLGPALVALLDVVAFRPDVPYLLWAAEWIGRRPDLKGIDAAAIEARLACFVDALSLRPGPGGLDNVSVALELAERLGERRPAHRVKLLLLRAMLLRAVGCGGDAEVLLRAEGRARSDPRIDAALGGLAMARGGLLEARDHFERALGASSADRAARLDLALTLALLGEPPEVCAASARLEGDDEAERAVMDAASAIRGDERARDRLAKLERTAAEPGLRLIARRSEEGRTRLPDIEDPVVVAASAAIERAASSRPTAPLVVRVRGGGRVAPSLRGALRAALRDLGAAGDLVADDEPAELGRTECELAVDERAAAVARLAGSSFDVDRWLREAPMVEPAMVRTWLGDPPTLPRIGSLGDALMRWQIASLCALAQSAPDHALEELGVTERRDDAYASSSARAVRLAITRRLARLTE